MTQTVYAESLVEFYLQCCHLLDFLVPVRIISDNENQRGIPNGLCPMCIFFAVPTSFKTNWELEKNLQFERCDTFFNIFLVYYKRQDKGKSGYLLQTMEIAIRETMKTTPAAADPAIRGSCSLSSDLKSSGLHKDTTDKQ